LFEHHPRRNIVSFIRTFLGGLRPRRFWTTLHPAQPSRPRRLVLYWIICMLLCLLAPLMRYLLSALDTRTNMWQERSFLTSYYLSPRAGTTSQLSTSQASASELSNIKLQDGSVQAFIDRVAPVPTLGNVLRETPLPFVQDIRYAGLARGNAFYAMSVFLMGGLILWPWLAALF